MSLVNIVSNVINKEQKVDRKKLAYLFRDYDPKRATQYHIGLLLRILKPENITVLDTEEKSTEEKTDHKSDQIRKVWEVMFPEIPLTIIYGKTDNRGNTVDRANRPVDREKLMQADVGLYISGTGLLYVYKGLGVPVDIPFLSNTLDQKGLEELRDADLDVLLPTQNMWMVNELTANRSAEIAICYFGTDDKQRVLKKINELVKILLTSSIRVTIHTHYFDEDFKGWEPEKESVQLFDTQYDSALVIRGDRVDVHLPYDNGAVAKEPNGWLLLN